MSDLIAAVLACVIASSAGYGVWRWRRLSTVWLPDRLLRSVVPFGAVIAGLCVIRQVLYSPFCNWNGARLASTFALAFGYQLYPGPNEGPLFISLHTPLSSLAYLPTVLAPNPTLAVMFGVVLSLAFTLGPVFWILASAEWRDPKSRFLALAAFTLFCLFAIWSFPLDYTLFWIRADNPVIGLSAASGAILYTRRRSLTGVHLFCSALCAVLAVWTKQTFAVVIPALLVYVALAHGRIALFHFAGFLTGAGIAVSGLFLAFFSPWRLLYNIVALPKNHPWVGVECVSSPGLSCTPAVTVIERIKTACAVAPELVQQCLVFALLIAVIVTLDASRGKRSKGFVTWVRSNQWVVFMFLAAALVPISIINRAKSAGESSSFAGSVYFLALSLVILLLRTATYNDMQRGGVSQFVGKTLMALLLVITGGLGLVTLVSLPQIIKQLPDNPQQLSYDYAMRHPGRAYFPWNPLASIMAEGRAYHFEFALVDRRLGGVQLTEEYVRRYLPERVEVIAYPPNPHEWQPQLAMKYLSGFRKRDGHPGFPGWTIYEANSDGGR